MKNKKSLIFFVVIVCTINVALYINVKNKVLDNKPLLPLKTTSGISKDDIPKIELDANKIKPLPKFTVDVSTIETAKSKGVIGKENPMKPLFLTEEQLLTYAKDKVKENNYKISDEELLKIIQSDKIHASNSYNEELKNLDKVLDNLNSEKEVTTTKQDLNKSLK